MFNKFDISISDPTAELTYQIFSFVYEYTRSDVLWMNTTLYIKIIKNFRFYWTHSSLFFLFCGKIRFDPPFILALLTMADTVIIYSCFANN